MKVIEKLRREINRKRWEQWRAQQKVEREKTYCYWSDCNVVSGAKTRDK